MAAEAEPGRAVLLVEALPERAPAALARTVHMMRAWVGSPFRAHGGIFDSGVIVDVALPGKFDLEVEVDGSGVEVDGAFQGNLKIQSGAAEMAFKTPPFVSSILTRCTWAAQCLFVCLCHTWECICLCVVQ